MSTVPPPPPPPNPYQPPESIPSLPSSSSAAAQVSGPATGLMITAAIGAALQATALFIHVLGIGLGSMLGGEPGERILNWMSGGFGIVSSVVGLLIAGLVLYAALEMRNLRQWGLALAASVLVMVPCVSPCCILGLPMGIWSLVVLVNDEVKRAFV